MCWKKEKAEGKGKKEKEEEGGGEGAGGGEDNTHEGKSFEECGWFGYWGEVGAVIAEKTLLRRPTEWSEPPQGGTRL